MNFRQVISNIKEGQEFKCDDGLFTIRCLNSGAIEIHNKDGRAFGFEKKDTFTKVEKPVSFMEVVESTKVCMVKHKLLENKYVWFKYYHFLNVLMNELSKEFDSTELKDIILNGEWYIEQ